MYLTSKQVQTSPTYVLNFFSLLEENNRFLYVIANNADTSQTKLHIYCKRGLWIAHMEEVRLFLWMI